MPGSKRSGWSPVASKKIFQFSEATSAWLIRDSKRIWASTTREIAIILHVLDQLYGLRCLVGDIQAMEASDRSKGIGYGR